MDTTDNNTTNLQNAPVANIYLIVDNEKIPANKELLCQASAYFSAMFRSNMKESFSTNIPILNVSAAILKDLVQSAYGKSIALNASSVFEILDSACMLQFASVIDDCIDYLSNNLSVENCLNIMFSSSRNGLQKLHKRARRKALWHFPEVRSHLTFYDLSLDEVKEYLREDMLKVTGEGEVLDAVLSWVTHDLNERQESLESVLECVRLGLLSQEELHTLLKQEVIQESPDVTQLINEVLYCKNDARNPSTNPAYFKARRMNTEIWLVGGELLYPDRKSQHAKIVLYDENEKQLHDIYEQLPPLVGYEREYLGYRSCLVGKDLYLCGGEITMGRNCWQLKVWRFDTFSESWDVVSQLPQPRRHLSLVTMETDLYLIGGFGRHRIMLDSVEKYDTASGEWSTVPNLNRAVYSAAACRHDNQIYVIKHDVEYYTPGDNSWTKITTPLPFEIGIHTCVSAGPNTIYLLGSYIKDLIEFNTDTLNLTKLGSLKDACGPAVLKDGVIYVLGGEEAETIESYNIRTREFSVECKIKVPLMSHGVAVVPCFPGYGKGAELTNG